MKRTKYTLTGLFNIACFFLFSQAEYIVEIDNVNGGFTKIQPAVVSGITWVYPNIRAYNETNGTYIFQTGPSNPDHLYSFDITNAAIISNPPFANTDGAEFEYDNSTGTLYGLFFDHTLNQYFLETINPATGAHVNVSTTPLPNMGICQGFSTFDEINHKYIMSSGNNLLSIDAVTGLISSNPTLGLLAGEVLVCASLSFNNSTGILYGLLWDANVTGKYFLASIDPVSGAITKIGTGTSLLDQNGSSAIDRAHGQYDYLHSNTSAGGYEIATMDIATGNLLYNKSVELFTNNDNFSGLEYDHVRGKLCAIHWETITTQCNLSSPNITTSQAIFCSGDSAHVCAPPGYATYLWNTGETASCINPLLAGNYYVTVTDNSGCTASSNHLAISVYPIPAVSISVNGDTLTAYGAVTYQWFLNGNAIGGATSDAYVANQAGNYSVAVTDANGCSAVSNTIFISGIGETEGNLQITVYPNPASTILSVVVPDVTTSKFSLDVISVDGRIVMNNLSAVQNYFNLDIAPLAAGFYLLRINGSKQTFFKKFVRK